MRSGLPNQDAIDGVDHAGRKVILAVADGHGSPKCFRSQRGSEFAVHAAMAQMDSVGRSFGNPQSLTQLNRTVDESLPKAIVQAWRQSVADHIRKHPFADEELDILRSAGRRPRSAQEDEPATDKESNKDELPSDRGFLAYGTTLLGVIVTENFIVYVQLGDGDILAVSEEGDVTRPVPGDPRLFGNETTSLALPTAWDDMRVAVQRLSEQSPPPALILASTDGYANSFKSDDAFRKVGSDLLELMRTNTVDAVKSSLKGWLDEASRSGSGDDVTVGLICQLDALKRQPLKVGPEAEFAVSQTTPVEKNEEIASSGSVDPRPIIRQRELPGTPPSEPGK